MSSVCLDATLVAARSGRPDVFIDEVMPPVEREGLRKPVRGPAEAGER